MQILIALCSNVLETMTVVVFGGPWGFYHLWWKLKSMILVHRLAYLCCCAFSKISSHHVKCTDALMLSFTVWYFNKIALS